LKKNWPPPRTDGLSTLNHQLSARMQIKEIVDFEEELAGAKN
jgi:hypothetical protein